MLEDHPASGIYRSHSLFQMKEAGRKAASVAEPASMDPGP